MENECPITRDDDDDGEDQYEFECFPVLTVATALTDSQTWCGREEIFARFLCKYDIDLEDHDVMDDEEQCNISPTLCTRNHWIPYDGGRLKFWVTDHVTGDGNCFFRSLSKAVTGIERFHPALRYVIVDHIRNHKYLYQCLIDGDIDAHIEHMRGTEGGVFSWATEAEVKASADLLGCDIYIQQQVGRKICWCLYKSDEQFKRFEHYFLTIIYDRHHFDLGRMVNHGCNCLLTREDVQNWEADVCETSDSNHNQLILWNKHNRHLKCTWNEILEHDDAITLFLTITLHLPTSMTSLPVSDIYLLHYKGRVYIQDMVHAQTWGTKLLAGKANSNESESIASNRESRENMDTRICKRSHNPVTIELLPNVNCMYGVFQHLWHAASRRRQIELLHVMQESANLFRGYTLAVHFEDLFSI